VAPGLRGVEGVSVTQHMWRGWEVLTMWVSHLLGLPVSLVAFLTLINTLTSHFDVVFEGPVQRTAKTGDWTGP
jgi:hypothetical protein